MRLVFVRFGGAVWVATQTKGRKAVARGARKGAEREGRQRGWGGGSRRWGLQRRQVQMAKAVDMLAADAKQVGR
jgi:hypothetical protein